MKIKPEIKRGAIVNITDWPDNYGDHPKEGWVVQIRFKKKGVELAAVREHSTEDPPKPKRSVVPQGPRHYNWTVADLEKIGSIKLPAIKKYTPLSEMEWSVDIQMHIEDDGSTIYYLWKAESSDYDVMHYTEQRNKLTQQDGWYNRCETVAACRNDWKLFAKRNGFKNSSFRAMIDKEWLLRYSNTKLCNEIFISQLHEVQNFYHRALQRYETKIGYDEHGPLEVRTTTRDRKRIRKEMEASGQWELFEIAKKMLFEDLTLINFYDGYPSLLQSWENQKEGDREYRNTHWLFWTEEAREKAGIKWSFMDKKTRREIRKPWLDEKKKRAERRRKERERKRRAAERKRLKKKGLASPSVKMKKRSSQRANA
jgi:hypothetical protein